MARTSSLNRFAALCAAFALGACATSGGLNEPRLSLSWEGDQITWTVENPHPHPIVIEEYRYDGMGVPVGVSIRVTDASGERLAYTGYDDDGWSSPWMNWSSTWNSQPLELAPATRFQHTFTAADLTSAIRVTEPIASEHCRYQVRIRVARPNRRAPTSLTSDWKEINCSALRIPYCPIEWGVMNCTGTPLPEIFRPRQ